MTSSSRTAAFPTDTSDVARQLLQADQCVLVVVDIQEKLLPPVFNKDELITNAQLLIRLANILELPVVATTQYTKGLGATVPQVASLLTQTAPIDKLQFSCFGCNEFRSSLKSLPGNRNTLLLC